MQKHIAIMLFFLPAVLPAQAPFRLAAGECDWQRAGAVWGLRVRGYSTQYNSSTWSALMALGEPDVWPRYGDIHGAWAPRSSSSPVDWIEIMFQAPVQASELWVFETNGTGSVYAVGAINPDGSVLSLAVATPERRPSAANQVVVPVVPARVIAGIRVAVSSAAADTYGEVDAVAAVPTRACSAGREFSAAASGIRLPPSAVTGPPPAGVVWASEVVRRSSEDARDRAAAQALGAPNVFPRFADVPGAWAPSSNDSRTEHVVLRFPATPTGEILVYETYGVGGLWMVEDLSGASPVALWSDGPSQASPSEARLLRIVLPKSRTISALRLTSSPRVVGSYPMVDAVGLVPAAAGAGARPKP